MTKFDNFYLQSHLLGQISLRKITKYPACREDVLQRAQVGLLSSSFGAPVYQKALKAYLEKNADLHDTAADPQP